MYINTCVCVYVQTARWVGHILRTNCSLKRLIEGKVERRVVTENFSISLMTLRK